MTNLGDRIIVLIDMDCFFCQVESRLQPELQGKPVAVVQYNQWRNGGIIAVNYEARDFGVTRHMRGDEAKEKCSDIVLVSVPSVRGKADTSKYRSAGREVIEVLKQHCSIIERASVDEAYLDITELVEKRIAARPFSQRDSINALANSFVVGYCDDNSNDEEQRRDGVEKWLSSGDEELGDEQTVKLATAGIIVEELRAEIFAVTKFRCSAGISYNKILAKLACGIHKPNKQTILPHRAVPALYSSLPVKKVRNLGGKFGNIVMESLSCNVMSDLTRYSLHDLQKRFDEKTGSWLYNIARGIDNEPVVTRLVCKSIGASKNFPGKQAIVKLDVLKHWINELSLDVSDRLDQDLEENERRATTLTMSFQYYEDRKVIAQSRSCPLKSYKSERIASQCLELITKAAQKPIVNIGIAAGKFIAAKGSGNFVNFFKNTGTNVKSGDTKSHESPKNRRISDKLENTENLEETCDETDSSCAKNFEIREESQNSRSLLPGQITNQGISEKKDNPAELQMKNTEISNESCRDAISGRQTNLETVKKPENHVKPSPRKHTNISVITSDGEPISPSTAILGSEDMRKILNRDNLKNSFFLNFLKDAQPETGTKSSVSTAKSGDIERQEESKESPQAESTVTSETAVANESETAKADETDLLSQLSEIFPDLDNMDNEVMKLLPIQLQRAANSYRKAGSNNTAENVKKVPKAKTKMSKTKGKATSNGFQNFFIKQTPSAEADYHRCSECDQMIKIEKFPEHLDFHMALNLQREVNRDSGSTADGPVKTSLNAASSKKRKSEENPNPADKRPKTISSFFGAN